MDTTTKCRRWKVVYPAKGNGDKGALTFLTRQHSIYTKFANTGSYSGGEV